MSDVAIPTVPSGAPAVSANPKFVDEVAKDVQGIVVSGFGDLEQATALFLDISNARGGAWLRALREAMPITPADGPQQPAAMIAFTCTGLRLLGVDEKALATFALPFQEGMLHPDRRRRLGDDDTTKPSTLSPGGLQWSGNAPLQTAKTPETVHALLVLYDTTQDGITLHEQAVRARLDAAGVAIVRTKELDLRVDPRGIAREHFGFSDGVSQPIPYDAKALPGGPSDSCHAVPLGEILIGYKNAHGEIAPGPVVPHDIVVPDGKLVDRSGVQKAETTSLPLQRIESSAGLHDLGLNGSYLVVRELKQDVASFWSSLDRAAQDLNTRAGNAGERVDADWLAARIVGRDKDGHLLGPNGPCPPLAGDLPDNAMLFFDRDVRGFGCPLGSHVRRANPRDGLAHVVSDCENLLDSANAHRILRRGRKFGTTAANDRVPDGEDRGLMFMCLNTDIVRQFEFIQQHWILNPNFATLYNEVDPLVGRAGKMTLPKEPLRRVVEVETYVTLTGGDYFFLPSLRALAYFETL